VDRSEAEQDAVMMRQSKIRKNTTVKTKRILLAAFVWALASSTALAQTAPKMKMTTDIPPDNTTPDPVETRVDTLKFRDGFPDDATVQKVYDNFDFMRRVEAFLNARPVASVEALHVGFASHGATDNLDHAHHGKPGGLEVALSHARHGKHL
jgi:hypothetical protein